MGHVCAYLRGIEFHCKNPHTWRYRALLNSRSIEQVRRSLSALPHNTHKYSHFLSILLVYCPNTAESHNILIIPCKTLEVTHYNYYDVNIP